ncbi:MAG: hypothetical protein U1E40_08895 [Amaricoccus sp.]
MDRDDAYANAAAPWRAAGHALDAGKHHFDGLGDPEPPLAQEAAG